MENGRQKTRYVIIGGVAGGATAAARIRRLTEDAEIVLLERGRYISYANCGLPYYIGGIIAERDRLFVQTPEAFGRRFNIDVRTENEATEILTERKEVRVRQSDGETYRLHYDKLLLSPGASPVRPPLPGIDTEGIFTLRNVDDTDRIKDYLSHHEVKKAVVVGGGFIGLEMTECLAHAGAEVAVVEMAQQVMAPIDWSMAAFVQSHLIEKGVKLHLRQAVEAFEKRGQTTVVRLKSGMTLEADIVLLSIGVRAETSLARTAGIAVGEAGGIKVDTFLQTSVKDVYAVGDAIEFPHPVTGQPWLNFLAGPANRQARIVADNMVGGNTKEYEGAIGTAIAKVFDIAVATTGLPAKRLRQMGIPFLSATIHSAAHAGYYPGARQMEIKITFAPDTGRLYGAQIVGFEGVDTRINQYALAIKQKATVGDLTRLEHAYAPPFSSAKDPVAVSAYVAENIITGRMQPLYWRELRDSDRKNVTLIDVRTKDEAALGTIEGAVNIPLDEIRERIGEIPHDKPVWLFCGVGLRGYLASNILKANGYDDVRNLIGGMRTYEAATRQYENAGSGNGNSTTAGTDEASSSQTPAQQTDRTATDSATRRIEVDACGLQCPGPIMRLKEAMETMQNGERIEISATDAAFPRDAEAWCRSTGNVFVGKTADKGRYIVEIEKREGQRTVSDTHANADGKTLILFSDDLDKVLATFVLANGAAATGKKVSIFFTFWGLNAIKKRKKPKTEKDFFGKMFGWMLPSDTTSLALSKMNMMGIGARMMRYLMKKKGVASLEEMRQQAIDNGVEFIACQMSMDVMGIKREELLDNVTVGGVATYMERAEKAGVNLFV